MLPLRSHPTAHYHASVETSETREEVFAYLSDLSTSAEWDPGVVRAERVDGRGVGEGAEYRRVTGLLGRNHELVYRTVEYQQPHLVAFEAETPAVFARDRVALEPLESGTRVDYTAELALKQPGRIADPILRASFRRVGERVHAGLLAALPPAAPRELPRLAGRALDGRSVSLPRDLAGELSVVLVAFARPQQAQVDAWLAWLLELERFRPDLIAYEVSVLAARHAPVRTWLNERAPRAVRAAGWQANAITVHADVGGVARRLGLRGPDSIAVVLVDRFGHVIDREAGAFDQLKARRLASAFERSERRRYGSVPETAA